MNESGILNSGVRFLVLGIIQVFLLKQISWGFGGKEFMYVFLYPLFILLLPLRLPRILIIFSSFVFGLTLDLFHETLGLHAAACTFSGFARPAVLQFVQPREKYNIKASPTGDYFGWDWFARYVALFLLLHLLFFFSVQAFTPAYWWDVLRKTFFTFISSYFTILFVAYVFNPKS